jgi:hypothetical protein
MADQKISELTALTGANVADDDAIAIVDTSATETKKIVFSELKNALDTATGFVRITGDTMTGALTTTGLTVDGDANLSGAAVNFDLDETDTTNLNTRFRQSAGQLFIQTLNDAKSLGSNRVNINHTTGDISFYDSAGSSQSFFWGASAESLGIGTSSPSLGSNGSGLHIKGASGEYGVLKVDSSTTSEEGWVQFSNNGVDKFRIASDSSTNLKFVHSGVAERMRIDSSGNVKINNGTLQIERSGSSPLLQFTDTGVNSRWMGLVDGTSNFTIYGTDGATQELTLDASGNLLVGQSTYSVNNGGIRLRQDGEANFSRSGQPTIFLNRVSSDGEIARFTKDGAPVGSIGTLNASEFGISSSNDLVLTQNTTTQRNLLFRDSFFGPFGSDNGALDLGRDTSKFRDLYLSGGVYLGGTAPTNRKLYSESTTYPQQNYMTTSGVNYPTLQLRTAYATGGQTATQIDFRNGADAAVGTITSTVSSTAYNTSSDYRLKTDTQPMTGATDRLKQLNPVNFEWIVDGTRVDGFLAHEAQAVVPEAVTGAKDAMRDEEYEVTPAVLDGDGNVVTEAVMGTRSVPDYQGIDQSKLVPLLVATIKELEARITALENA